MNYKKLTTGIIVAWFIFALSASALHLFKNNANRIGLSVAIAALTPIIVFSLWYVASAGFRQFALSLDPRLLTSLQAWRIIGFTFVLLEARGALPAVFALPAGYGDMAIGATAAFVAWKLADPAHRNSFILWQLLGILDLVIAVSVGTTAAWISPQGPPMVPMTVLPWSLIPTFLVPLIFDFSRNQHRTGKDLGNFFRAHSSNSNMGAACRHLKPDTARQRSLNLVHGDPAQQLGIKVGGFLGQDFARGGNAHHLLHVAGVQQKGDLRGAGIHGLQGRGSFAFVRKVLLGGNRLRRNTQGRLQDSFMKQHNVEFALQRRNIRQQLRQVRAGTQRKDIVGALRLLRHRIHANGALRAPFSKAV
jgi:hypothetical protein